MAQPQDFLNIVYYYHMNKVNGTSWTTVDPTLGDPLLSFTDNERTGRCYTILPTYDMILRKIKKATLWIKTIAYNHGHHNLSFTPDIYFHQPGTFKKGKAYGIQSIVSPDLSHVKQPTYLLEYEVHTKQSYASKPPCEQNSEYNYDLCVDLYIEEKAIKKFGCTTPFGPNKDKICTDLKVAMEVFGLYREIWKNQETSCKVPCTRYTIKPALLKEQPLPWSEQWTDIGAIPIDILFNEEILTSEEVFLYSTLSLIAEIGGYVGLFLGVSVYQISSLAEMIFVQIIRWRRRL